MKPVRYFLLLFCLLLPFSSQATELRLGAPLTIDTVTKVSEINKDPDQYLGKNVLIEGLVINVCAKRGCWMDLASDLPFEKIQVKVVDGEIVFPMEAKGRIARVEGTVDKVQLSQDQAIRMGKHKAEEQGIPFDPASVTGPETFYRIKGLGAVIK